MAESTPIAEAQAVANLVERLHDAKVITPTAPDVGSKSIPVLLLPSTSGVGVHSLKKFFDEYRTAPERRQGTAHFQDLASFCEHVRRFMDDDSVVFADTKPSAPTLTAVLDYHRKNADGAPRFGTHRAHYPFPLSEEWTFWTALHKKMMGQKDFAELIEDRIADIIEPSTATKNSLDFAAKLGCAFATPGEVLSLSRGLEVHVSSKVRNAHRLANGESQFQYETTHAGPSGQPLTVPGAVLLAIPIFKGDVAYQIPVRLRYRVADDTVVWSFELYRTDLSIDHAIKQACDLVQQDTKLPLFLGRPE